jgi:hypothetical protein
MRNLSGKLIKLSDFQTDVSNKAYKSVITEFESLEHFDLFRGNGHHAAQAVAEYASNTLKERINNNKELKYHGIIRGCGVEEYNDVLVTLSEKFQISENFYLPVIDGPEDILAIRTDSVEILEKSVWDILKKDQ